MQVVTVGTAYTSPRLTIPDVMLLARPAVSCAVGAKRDRHTQGWGLKSAKSLELTRLLPLKFVKLSIYSDEKKQLHLKFATGCSFYLNHGPFRSKRCMCTLGRPGVLPETPVEADSSAHAAQACDMMDIPVLEAEDKRAQQ